MALPRRTHEWPPGTPNRCRPSATPSPRFAGRSGTQRNYRCPGQGRRRSKFPLLCFSAWSTPSAPPPDAAHIRWVSEMLNRPDQVVAGGKSSSADGAGGLLRLGDDVIVVSPSVPSVADLRGFREGGAHRAV